MNRIYLDHAATTPVKPEAFEQMKKYFINEYGNPSAIYQTGVSAQIAVSASRRKISTLINAEPEEIIFTSGGTESDNWALRGALVPYIFAAKSKDDINGNKMICPHIIITEIEHHAILNTAEYLKKFGVEVTVVHVDSEGYVNPADIEHEIRKNTVLISVMMANNEIGTIEPVKEIGKIAHEHGILFHTDAVQAFGHIEIDVRNTNIDLMSVSGHKFGGPKGTGFLYKSKKIKIENMIFGGGQEMGLRAGTENVSGIVGMTAAAEISCGSISRESERQRKLSDLFYKEIKKEIPFVYLNGPEISSPQRLPNNINIEFKDVLGESLLIMLDMNGIAASAGSACTAGALEPSHVLSAIKVPEEEIMSSIRFTIGEENTKEELMQTVAVLKSAVQRLRSMNEK